MIVWNVPLEFCAHEPRKKNINLSCSVSNYTLFIHKCQSNSLMIILMFFLLLSLSICHSNRYGQCKRWNKATTNILYTLSNIRAGERVPFQSLPDPSTTHWNRTRSLPHRTPNQNLVPKSPHEMEEGAQNGNDDPAISHVTLRSSISIWYSSVTVCAFERIGRVALFEYWLETQSAVPTRSIPRISK